MTSSVDPAPIGVFWDIENCCVPKWKSALCVVRSIRDNFFSNRREVCFMCVCDTTKLNKDVIQELNSAQVDIVHINATSKNAADDKLRQSLRRFADTFPSPAVIVLISSDINFASDLSDLRHRKGYHVILVHSKHVHEALKLCANENWLYEDIVKDIPRRQPDSSDDGNKELSVSGFPSDTPSKKVECRLKKLSANCGGRVVSVTRKLALIRFASEDDALRAKTRMEGEDVFGQKIKVDLAENMGTEETPNHSEDTPQNGRKNNSEHRKRSKSRDRKQEKTIYTGNGHVTPGKNFKRKITIEEDCEKEQNQTVPSLPNGVPESHTVNQNDNNNANQEDHDNNIQNVVDKFSKDRKSSRHVLMLQQQLYQEGQETTSRPLSQPIFEHDLHHMLSHPPPPIKDDFNASYGYKGQGHYNSYGGYSSDWQSYTQDQNYYSHYNHGTSAHDTSFDAFSCNGYRHDNKNRNSHMYGPTNNNLNQSLSSYEMLRNEAMSKGSYSTKPYRYQNYSCASYSSSYSYQASSGQRQSPHNSLPYPSSNRSSPYQTGSQWNGGSNRSTPTSFTSQNSFKPILHDSPSTGSCSPCEQEVTDWDSVIGPVELLISNLDYNISAKEWRKILFTTFHPHVRVLNVHVKMQPDNTSIGMVKVPSKEEARFAISQFHRKKIGYKRIHVTLKNEEGQRPASTTRMEAVALLSEAKDNMLPLFKFIELFDKRYHRSISVSELYKMRDIVDIREQGGAGRMVYLASSAENSSPTTETADGEVQEILEQPVCLFHCPEGSATYAEAVNSSMLPNVKMSIKSLAPQVHSLLQTHDGNMPLMSFPACYSAEFSTLPVAVVTQGGVPLEHLIGCVPGIQIQVSPSGVKKVQWAENQPPFQQDLSRSTSSSPMLSQQLNQICREMVDLLKQSPQCRMPMSKFIPSYHHFFGRQCRVADYGYNRLKDLFDAIPHVIQVLGTGDRKVLALSHKAQMRRFINDLVKLLKAQPGRQIPVSALPQAFSKMLNKTWDVTEYGMSFLDDLLSEVPGSTAMVTTEGGESIVAIPRKDQTNEEIERTKQFALEVVDLLKHNPQCRMPFNKFIPAYHHHFGRQCRVSDYGFSKLVDLFEAIPHVVELEDEGEERLIHLTQPELRKILAEQMVGLLRQQKGYRLPLHHLMSTFTCHYGFNIPLYDFNVDSEEELMNKIQHVVKVEMINRCKYVMLQDRRETPKLAHEVLQLLMDQSGGSLPLMELSSRYYSIFGVDCNVRKIKDELLDYVQVIGDDESAVISLTPLQAFARDVRLLLHEHGRIYINQFDRVYKERFGVELKPALFGCPTVLALLQTIPHIAAVGGKPMKKYCQLSADLPELPQYHETSTVEVKVQRPGSDSHSSDSGVTDTHPDDEEIMSQEQLPTQTQAALDLMSGRVPSTVPSPDLQPVAPLPENLMSFESMHDVHDKIWMLSEDEKRGQKTPLCRTPTSDLLNFAAQCLISHPPPSSVQSDNTSKNKSNNHLSVQSYKLQQSGVSKEDSKISSKGSISGIATEQASSEDAAGWWRASPSQMEEIRQSYPEECPSQGRSVCEDGAGPVRGIVNKVKPTEVAEKKSLQKITILKKKPDAIIERTESQKSSDSSKEVVTQEIVLLKSNTQANAQSEASKHRLKLPAATGKVDNMHSFMLSADPSTYDHLFRQELPLDTSSVKSDSSTLSDISQGSPRKSPRKKRIAAKFSMPMNVNYSGNL